MTIENLRSPRIGPTSKKHSIPSRLRSLLESQGRKITWLSNRTGIEYNHLCRVCSGASEPTLREAFLVKLALLCDLEQVFDTDFQLPPLRDDDD